MFCCYITEANSVRDSVGVCILCELWSKPLSCPHETWWSNMTPAVTGTIQSAFLHLLKRSDEKAHVKVCWGHPSFLSRLVCYFTVCLSFWKWNLQNVQMHCYHLGLQLTSYRTVAFLPNRWLDSALKNWWKSSLADPVESVFCTSDNCRWSDWGSQVILVGSKLKGKIQACTLTCWWMHRRDESVWANSSSVTAADPCVAVL